MQFWYAQETPAQFAFTFNSLYFNPVLYDAQSGRLRTLSGQELQSYDRTRLVRRLIPNHVIARGCVDSESIRNQKNSSKNIKNGPKNGSDNNLNN